MSIKNIHQMFYYFGINSKIIMLKKL